MAGREKGDDVAKLTEALRKERDSHKIAAAALKAAQGKIAELEQQSALGENPSASKVSDFIAASVAAKVAAETGELQKKIGALEVQLGEATAARAAIESKLSRRTMDDAVRTAANEARVKPEAIADVLTIAGLELQMSDSGEVVAADGQDVNQWLDARRGTSPHWWPTSRGAGAKGSGAGPVYTGENPFAAGSFNLTRQGELLRSNPTMAKQLQESAVTITGG
jgi:hypothetical protein